MTKDPLHYKLARKRSSLKTLLRRIRRGSSLLGSGITLEFKPSLRVYSYGKFLNSGPDRYALLSYLAEPILNNLEGGKALNFSNAGLALALPRVLNELGYTVDIINWDDTQFKPKRSYDLFIAHGGKNFRRIHQSLPSTPIIYFSTGSYWQWHNSQELLRLEYFKKRRDTTLPPDRFITDSEEEANRAAAAIICLGNEDTKKTYSKFKHVYNLPVGSYQPRSFWKSRKNHLLTKGSFLFFSGGGNVHKGLDLLLEAFEGTNHNLFICTLLDPAFEKYYHKHLYEQSNIHYLGFTPAMSKAFFEVTKKCSFVILPSCSEGSPGSIVDCMQLGLIPVVSEEAHLDTGSFGVRLSDSKVGTIKRMLDELSQTSEQKLRRMSELSRLEAKTTYSPAQFEANLTAAFRAALAGSSQK